ncbi:LOW QUALITY PROTEIN: hypothetical protein EUGRSUZ_K01305 [Eucalyptus grandis]|uniref:Uncharacterized protein n=1 Tax=Eucalyptus grandis TaxID=71139 RepID=A0ACC3ISZ7_EUCGR|nr:LOW QUALITY PROTEIN: hypothetical protein EUGRSUZ_K01305 [Eucalyptus grandis]
MVTDKNPGYNKVNRDLWQIREEVDSLILKVVRARQEENRSSLKPEKDQLQTILESADVDDAMNEKACFSFVVDPCKNITFQEMTATTISWSVMQLALHPEWQDRVRAEIAEFCGDRLCHRGSLDFETLRKLKVCAANHGDSRDVAPLPPCDHTGERNQDKRSSWEKIDMPEGAILWTSIPLLHRERAQAVEVQGRGVRGLQASSGVRAMWVREQAVLVQTFATLEMKIVLAFILSWFSFSLSPEYRHSPVYRMVLVPEHGMRLVLRKI